LAVTFTQQVVLPIGLGLLGFVEPCSIGTTLLFVKYLEANTAAGKLAQACVFAITRAAFIGLLGVLAVLVGDAFFGFQRAAWAGLGAFYILLGVLHVTRKQRILEFPIGLGLNRASPLRGSALVGVFFGLNIPACAAPLLLALLAAAAAGGAGGATLVSGFVSLGLFGLALSLPIAAVVLFKSGRRALDVLASLSQRLPIWAGLVLIVLGLWSIWFAVSAKLQPP
jgi:cytochrome c-type biogenesis protein